jgi:hypothetical protein
MHANLQSYLHGREAARLHSAVPRAATAERKFGKTQKRLGRTYLDAPEYFRGIAGAGDKGSVYMQNPVTGRTSPFQFDIAK